MRIIDDEPFSYWTHWIPQINSGKGGSVDCMGKGCPVCKIIANDKKEGNKARYSSTKKHKINVILRGATRGEDKVAILNAGETVFDQLKQIMMQMGDLKSYDVTVTKTGSGKQSKYSVLPTFPPTPLTENEQSLEKYDIPNMHKPLTEEQVKMLLEGKSYKDIFTQEESDTEEVPDFTQE